MGMVLHALRQQAIIRWQEDATQAFFWWSNLQMLRLFLAQLEAGDVYIDGDWSWLRPEMDSTLEVSVGWSSLVQSLRIDINRLHAASDK
jgi:hypothetical protein